MWSMPPSSSFCPLLYLYGGCLSSRGHGCSWLGYKVFPAISAISILELATNSGSNVNLEMSRCCHSLRISLHFLKTRVWPLLWWGFSFRTSFCLFYIVAKSGKRLPHSHLALITQGTLGHTALTPEFWWVPHWQLYCCSLVAVKNLFSSIW